MATVKVEVVVSKEAHELGQGVASFIGKLKAAVADGWQVGQDIPAVLAAAMSDLVPAVIGAEKIPAEVKEDTVAFGMACAVTGGAILAAATK